MNLTLRNMAKIAGIALVGSLLAGGAHASLVTNGSFESNGGAGQIGFNTTLTGWTTSSYSFLFTPGASPTSPGSFGPVTLPAIAPSPDGGFFIGADGGVDTGPISQTLTGLTPGAQYTVSFDWAGAEQTGFSSATTEQWDVSFGSSTLATATISDAAGAATAWKAVSLTFTADSTSDVLSFLAVGSPAGAPPFVLLDGVAVNAVSTVPEPSSIALLGAGLVGFGALARRRRKG